MSFKRLIIAAGCCALSLAAPPAATADHGRSALSNATGASSALHHGGRYRPDGKLVRAVKRATGHLHDVRAAEAAGYALHFGCVSSPDQGAMGLHYVNMDLVGDGALDPLQPEIVIYEPLQSGRLRLIGADFLVLADAWHAHSEAPPQLMGQLLHRIESPNRYGLPTFYTLHVWAWKKNRHGTFTNWHPDVSCEHFDGQEH